MAGAGETNCLSPGHSHFVGMLLSFYAAREFSVLCREMYAAFCMILVISGRKSKRANGEGGGMGSNRRTCGHSSPQEDGPTRAPASELSYKTEASSLKTCEGPSAHTAYLGGSQLFNPSSHCKSLVSAERVVCAVRALEQQLLAGHCVASWRARGLCG